MPRTKVTLEEVHALEDAASAALAKLHKAQQHEQGAHVDYRAAVAYRQGAEKDYASAIRRFKLAEAKLPPPEAKRAAWSELHDTLRSEPTVFADGEPVEV